jgi:hypothetical protein
MKTGVDRFVIDFDKIYKPFPKQAAFHASPAPMRFLGGAAGPGKTACLIVDHMIGCQGFNVDQAKHVHTLLLRRTQPQLESTLLTRFRELIPSELYRKFNQSPGRTEVTWLNGSTTKFGSMQYEDDAWGYQGQWWKIGYDEMCEFTFKQWNAVSAWNRCPVSKYCTKDGAGNPIGVGSLWVEDLFVKKQPCHGMDDNQKLQYNPADYAYFPCTYRDNPIYASDPIFLKNLESYPAAIRDALKLGKWGLAGGFFRGIWDEAIHKYEHHSVELKPYWRRWISGNWGYEHPASYYKHCMDDQGLLYTYDELYVQHLHPEKLAESIGRWAQEPNDRGAMATPSFTSFAMSFDAWASKKTATMGENTKSVAMRMAPILREWGVTQPHASTRDKTGRDTLMAELLAKRIRTSEDGDGHPIRMPAWRISDRCAQLTRVIPVTKRDEGNVEQAENIGDGSDSPLQGCGYGLYDIFGGPAEKPLTVQKQELWAQQPERTVHSKVMQQRAFDATHRPVKPARGRTTWSR